MSVHGTGTPLGDPIEVGALGQGLSGAALARPLTMLSNKSCFGHTEGAAGKPTQAASGLHKYLDIETDVEPPRVGSLSLTEVLYFLGHSLANLCG